MRFPIAKPMVGEAEATAVARAVLANEVSKGSSIAEFELGFAQFMGEGEAVTASSGTAALELAARALGLSGEHVLTGAMSCQATANALISAGCTVGFVDQDPATWQMCVDSLRARIHRRTKGVVVAHLYGGMAAMHEIASVCREHGLLLIEDCSQGMGARWLDTMAGGFGDAASFSFYGNKLITTGEGGMVWTRSAEVAQRARLLRNHGQDAPFHHVAYGLNWKMPNLLAALGVEQLRRVPELIAARRDRFALLHDRFAGRSDIRLPSVPAELFLAPFCFPLVLRDESRDRVADALASLGIETRPLFPPQYLQPYWPSLVQQDPEHLPVAEELGSKGIYLSTSPHLSLKHCDYIASCLVDILEGAEKHSA